MFYIRADANKSIGIGHMMRCLSIAEELRDMGEEVVFLVADNEGEFLLENKKFPRIVMHTDWKKMEQELLAIERIIRKEHGQGGKLLVDSYQVTERYLAYLREQIKLIYIDDINQFHYPVDALICYSNCWRQYQYPQNYPHTKLLLGPSYTPLRKGFRNCRRKKLKAKVEEILLMSGGTDNYHAIKRILSELCLDSQQKLTVVCGKFHLDYVDLSQRYKDCKNVTIYDSVWDLQPYMEKADLAISAGGTTLCELCAVGTPTVSFSLAENQIASAERYDKDGIIEYAGDVRGESMEKKVVQLVEKYCNDANLRMEISQKMQAYMDGCGASRVAEEMICL